MNMAHLLFVVASLGFSGTVRATVAFEPTADLPDLLTALDGSQITTPAHWEGRRAELKQLLDAHILGTRPTTSPSFLNATTIAVHGNETNKVVKEHVRLHFSITLNNSQREQQQQGGEDSTGDTTTVIAIDIEFVYAAGGTANREPRPAVVTQFDHREWALRGVSRGWVGVLVPTGDAKDATFPFYLAYNRTVPRPTWGLITRRAWLVSLVLDYVVRDRRDLIDPTRLSMFGHSRNGKQTLITAAYDTRLQSVVGSSPGFPIATPARFAGNEYAAEQWFSSYAGAGAPCPSPPPGEVWPRWEGCHWWADSTLAFYGRASELEADGHMVTALIAPRPMLIGSAHNDHDSDNSFANERNLAALEPVQTLLGASAGTARLTYRPGDHVGLIDVELYFDWFAEAAAGRVPSPLFPEQALHAFNWSTWRARADPIPPMPTPAAPLGARVQWLLGDPLPRLGGHTVEAQASQDYLESLLLHDTLNGSEADAGGVSVSRVPVGVGDGLTAELYYPTAAGGSGAAVKPLRVVVVLPGLFYNSGFSPGHYSVDWAGVDGEPKSHGDVYHYLASQGYAALGFDPDGSGVRVATDGPPDRFYRRYPKASRFGRMLQDLQSILDWCECASAPGKNATRLDKESADHRCSPWDWPTAGPGYHGPPLERGVWLAGYSIGGLLALHAAALDSLAATSQIAGVASFAGFTPLRADANDQATGGTKRWSHWHGLLPRLGLGVPYDVDELLAAVAPRPTLLYTPQRDQGANYTEVLATIDTVRADFPPGRLTHVASDTGPESVSEFGRVQIDALAEWLKQQP